MKMSSFWLLHKVVLQLFLYIPLKKAPESLFFDCGYRVIIIDDLSIEASTLLTRGKSLIRNI